MTAVIITTPSNAITPRSIKGFEEKSRFEALNQIRLLLKEGYLISRTSYPRTTDGSKCIMIKLKSTDDNPKECLITAFDDEAIALSKFIATLL
ncbi:MAG: hypothetical protein M3247_02410 [Thermoproteota archaeon]|jgi:hypothetical protein|nr:hypothetical protein [Thermoproteota archaeon]